MKYLTGTQATQSEDAEKQRVDFWVTDDFTKELYYTAFSNYPIECKWELAPKNWRMLLRRNKPRYLILDLSLFAENPIQAINEIKTLSPSTEIIVLSHSDDVHVAISAFKSGISDYYLKPTNPETLWYALQKIFSKKEIQPNDPVLLADLEVFSATHQLTNAESDLQMREITAHQLIGQLKAKGAVWLCPNSHAMGHSKAPTQIIDGTPFNFEWWGKHSLRDALDELMAFNKKYPLLIRDSFFTSLTSHPEHWLRERFAWIPLKNSSYGGFLVFGLKEKLSSTIETRVEFLIRSLETSLENHRRYIDAKQLTYIDDLTGLYNPRFLEKSLTIAMNHLDKKEQGFCVLFIDIDKFKQVNDHHGHVIGSQMLTHIGKLLKNTLRQSDQVFRYGGDEFIAILYKTELAVAKEIAERLRKAAEARTFSFPKAKVKITLSIGIARFPDHGTDKATIISMADNAMYASKKQGRNQVIIAETKPHG